MNTFFSSQGVVDLVVECIDRLHQYSDVSCDAEASQSEEEEQWEKIIPHFYKLLSENNISED